MFKSIFSGVSSHMIRVADCKCGDSVIQSADTVKLKKRPEGSDEQFTVLFASHEFGHPWKLQRVSGSELLPLQPRQWHPVLDRNLIVLSFVFCRTGRALQCCVVVKRGPKRERLTLRGT